MTSYFPFFFVFFLLRPTSDTLWYTLLDFQKHHYVSVHFENDLLSLFIGACMLVCNSVLNHLYLFNNHILFEESRNCQDGSKEPNITHFARTEILSFVPPSLLCLQIQVSELLSVKTISFSLQPWHSKTQQEKTGFQSYLCVS